MRTTANYLDALKARFKVESDGGLIEHTGWRRQVISRYRTERSTFDDATAQKVAGWLNVPLAQVLVDMNAERARSEEVRRAWLKLAAAVAGVAVVMLAGGDQLAALLPASLDAADFSGLYIMLNRSLHAQHRKPALAYPTSDSGVLL